MHIWQTISMQKVCFSHSSSATTCPELYRKFKKWGCQTTSSNIPFFSYCSWILTLASSSFILYTKYSTENRFLKFNNNRTMTTTPNKPRPQNGWLIDKRTKPYGVTTDCHVCINYRSNLFLTQNILPDCSLVVVGSDSFLPCYNFYE